MISLPSPAPEPGLELVLLPEVNPVADRQMTVAQAVKRYLAMRVAEGGIPLKGDTFRHNKKHLVERLCAYLGSMPLAQVRADHLRAWMEQLTNTRAKGRPMHAITRAHHLKDTKAFFKRCVAEDWIDKSPAHAVKQPVIASEDVNVLSVRDAFHLFKANREDRGIGRVALEAFGGVRFSTAGRLAKSDIKFALRGIEMPANKHKSRKRMFRQGHPENLWKWLDHAPDECWALSLRQYAEHKKFIAIIARLRPAMLISEDDRTRARAMKNVLRHTFASALLAITKTYPPVSYLMGHTSGKMTAVYEGKYDEGDAKLYFSITPETVLLSWEEFVAKYRPSSPSTAATPIVGLAPAIPGSVSV